MGYSNNDTMVGSDNELLKQIVGIGDADEAVDISIGNHTCVMTNCKAISCIDGSVIYVDYVNGAGVTRTNVPIPAELRIIPLRNITKVYQAGTDSTIMRLWR